MPLCIWTGGFESGKQILVYLDYLLLFSSYKEIAVTGDQFIQLIKMIKRKSEILHKTKCMKGKKIISEFYKHEQFNGKDIGCAALKIIAKGTLIMVEKPQVTAKGVLISDGIFNLVPSSRNGIYISLSFST